MNLLELHEVRRRFHLGDTTIEALAGISLEVRAGEFLAVWGPSGSGKSTLMALIGLIDRPNSGKMRFEGEDVAGFSEKRMAKFRSEKIGFVFQNFNLVPVLSALENVMLPLQIRGRNRDFARRRAQDALTEVGLEKFIAFRPDKLSGGQRQRVAIARALAGEPRLVIADEPTANLDSENGRTIIELMRKLNRQKGVTFVFTTHDPRLIEHVDRKILLQDGCVALDEVRS